MCSFVAWLCTDNEPHSVVHAPNLPAIPVAEAAGARATASGLDDMPPFLEVGRGAASVHRRDLWFFEME